MVSAGAGEGKSTTTLNLATVFARLSAGFCSWIWICAVPRFTSCSRWANNLGLTNYLLKQNTLSEIVQTHFRAQSRSSWRAANCPTVPWASWVQPRDEGDDPPNSKQRYDFILFDSPPILGVSDASILASEVDLVMQVIQYRRYPQPMTIRAKQMIEKVGGNFVGMVLNNINMAQDEGYYYYSGYYHDYYYFPQLDSRARR